MSKILNKVFPPRCRHRHTIKTHRNCFDENGFPKDAKPTGKLPEVWVLDIETSPLEAYVFQSNVWRGNINQDQVISEWFMLTWSAKKLFGDTVYSERLTGKEAVKENDSRIVAKMWKILDDADIVIAHNGDKFDVPNLNTRFIVNDLYPPSPYQSIDTLKIARRQFGFTHNNLDALARVLGFDAKMKTDFELWKRAKNGDDEALEYMRTYNDQDVLLLEDVYMKLRPWIKGHPNLGLFIESDIPVCSHCGSSDLTPTGKFSYTSVSKFPLYRCECGAYVRVRQSSFPKELRKNLAVPLFK